MVFSSMSFLFIFFPIVLFLYYVPLSNIKARNFLLLVVSFIFYGVGEPIYIFAMFLSIIVNFRVGVWIDHAQSPRSKKHAIVAGVVYNLAVLFMFKYESFVIQNINILWGTDIPSLGLSLPIGISFYTFQAMSYIIDVYRKTVPVQKNIANLGLYIAFFTQLIAGPIVRYSTIQEQIGKRTTTLPQFYDGIMMFIAGMGKKVILANNFALVSEASFATAGDEMSVAFAWLGAICYTFQIFFDFAGYSDMAIGLAKMFGFNFEMNFNYPYISKSVTEFWRRWHISLGTWFRDYVYIPLGGSRVNSRKRLVFNLFIVWALTGIWHGAAWQFLVWGLIYFVALTFEKLTGFPHKSPHKVFTIPYQIVTMLIVVLGWVIFGEMGLKNGVDHISAMFALSRNALVDGVALFYLREVCVLLVIAVFLSTPLFRTLYEKVLNMKNIGLQNTCMILRTVAYMGVFLLAVSYLVMGAHNPFIYFNF